MNIGIYTENIGIYTYVQKLWQIYIWEEFFIWWRLRNIAYAYVLQSMFMALYFVYCSVFCLMRHVVRWGPKGSPLKKGNETRPISKAFYG